MHDKLMRANAYTNAVSFNMHNCYVYSLIAKLINVMVLKEFSTMQGPRVKTSW